MDTGLRSLHTAAAVVTWAVVFGLSLFFMRDATGPYASGLPIAVSLQIITLILMLVAGSARIVQDQPQIGRLLFFVLLLTILILGWRTPIEFFQIYTIMWITLAPHYFSRRTSFVLLVLVAIAWYLVARFSWQANNAFAGTLLFATFHFFALLSSLATVTATEATERSQQLNRDLMATQHLLAEASRQGERTRIARDLHDLLGHHLTALTINLQVAGHLTQGEAKEKIDQCHSLSKLLLNDVRDAVTTLREESAVNFTQTLKLIVDNVPNLKINLDIDTELSIDDVKVADALLRCVQEAITNTLRHSNAKQSWLKVWREKNDLRLSFHDDGKVTKQIVPGNGLAGMRERIDRLGGELVIDTLKYFKIQIHVPMEK